MAEITSELREVIDRYCLALRALGIETEQVLLFGSHQSGTAREGSDIDLIIVSGDWGKKSLLERLRICGIAAARILEPVEASAFTPDEIASGKVSPFWENVLKHEAVPV